MFKCRTRHIPTSPDEIFPELHRISTFIYPINMITNQIFSNIIPFFFYSFEHFKLYVFASFLKEMPERQVWSLSSVKMSRRRWIFMYLVYSNLLTGNSTELRLDWIDLDLTVKIPHRKWSPAIFLLLSSEFYQDCRNHASGGFWLFRNRRGWTAEAKTRRLSDRRD